MNTFDQTWEKVHSEREWGKYPSEELVRFIMGNFKDIPFNERKNIKILELGCGSGANIWFLSREGFDAYGLDGSKTAILKAEKMIASENLFAHFQVGDFIHLEKYEDNYFDAIIDVVSLSHNRVEDIKNILLNVKNKLKTGGKVFSILFGVKSYGDEIGSELEKNTYTNIHRGPFKGLGRVHFFEENEVLEVFEFFHNVNIEYSVRSLMNKKETIRHWIVTCDKK